MMITCVENNTSVKSVCFNLMITLCERNVNLSLCEAANGN